MSDTSQLEDMLDAAPVARNRRTEPEPQTEATAPEPAPTPEPMGDKPESTAPPADAKPEPSDGGVVPQRALLDERRKRQELERKFAELQEKLAAPQPKPEPVQAPSWDLEPQQAASHFQQQIDIARYQDRVAITEELLKEKYADYDEVAQIFAAAAQSNPQLAAQIFQAPNPARFAYQEGKRLRLLQEIGDDPDAYRARLEAEILERHGVKPGQPAAAPAQAQRQASPVPRSLARDVSQQPRNPRGQFDGPASLDELIG